MSRIKKIYTFLCNAAHLNWCATLALNVRAGGIWMIARMPIKVYGPLRWNVTGRIVLPHVVTRGMLTIGSQHEDYTAASGRAEINIAGEWCIGGTVAIGPDSFIGVAPGARLTISDDCHLGRDTQIHCSNHIHIGKGVFAGETYITDSSEHVILRNGEPQTMNGRVVIGDGTYLAFRTILLKGSVIPPRSVVASGAVCTRDYTSQGAECLFLAGVPAEVRQSGVSAVK